MDPSTPVHHICYHGGKAVIIYQPLMYEALANSAYGAPDTPPPDYPHGATFAPMTYQLIEVSQSPFWTRLNQRDMYGWRTEIGTEGYASGFEGAFAFADGNTPQREDANPMWAWRGGSGSCPLGFCWYSFSVDGSIGASDKRYWPTGTPGRFLLDPALEASVRFPGLPDIQANSYRYNPYFSNPPNYYSSPISLSINGPQTVAINGYNNWQAVVSGGLPPYTYQWSGVLAGAASNVNGGLYSSGYLDLDIWDAAGVHYSTGIYIMACPDAVCSY